MAETQQKTDDKCQFIRKLGKHLSTCKDIAFTTDELRKLGIDIVPASFARAAQNTGLYPCFFLPYPRHLLTPPREEMEVRPFPKYGPERVGSSVERAQELELFLGEYLSDCGAQHPEIN